MPNTWVAVLAAVPPCSFAMTGAEITTIAAAESRNLAARWPDEHAVILRILIFYVVSLFLIVRSRPGTRCVQRIAVHPGLEHHACALGTPGHERDHSLPRCCPV